MKTKTQSLEITDDVVYVNGVPFYRESEDLTKAKKVIEKWEWINFYIRTELADAQESYDGMKENGLSFNVIEAEGFLRAIKTIQAQLNHINESIDQ